MEDLKQALQFLMNAEAYLEDIKNPEVFEIKEQLHKLILDLDNIPKDDFYWSDFE